MDINGIRFVAPPASVGIGAKPQLPIDTTGVLMASEYQPRYSMAAYSRQSFNASNQAGVTTSVAFATTYTGLVLSNSPGNSVNLHVLKVGAAFLVAFAAAATIGIMCGFNAATAVTHTTPGTPRNSFFGVGLAGAGLVDTAATLPTAPVLTHVLAAGLTGAITTAPLANPVFYDMEGSLIIPPGGYAAIFTSTASGAAALWGSFAWLELPV